MQTLCSKEVKDSQTFSPFNRVPSLHRRGNGGCCCSSINLTIEDIADKFLSLWLCFNPELSNLIFLGQYLLLFEVAITKILHKRSRSKGIEEDAEAVIPPPTRTNNLISPHEMA